jgi:hypothetical protein
MTELAPRLPFPVSPRRPGDPVPDLTGFELTHRAMRSGTYLLAGVLAEAATYSPERHRAVAYFTGHVLAEISAHHHKEDDVLWPVIAASAAGRVDLTALSGDHAALEAVLVRADAALGRFRADRGAADELGEVLTGIAGELDEHIADEEATIFPVMREHVSAADFARCEKLFQRGVKPGHLAFILPWFLAQCTEAERREMLPAAPLPLRLFLRAAEPRWHRRLAVVRGQ